MREVQYTFIITSRSVLLRVRNTLDKIVKKIKSHFIFSNFFENRVFYDIMWENTDKDDKMAHSHFVLVAQGYRLTLRICNTYCFSTVKMVSRTLLTVRLILILPVLLVLPRDFSLVLDAITIGLNLGCCCRIISWGRHLPPAIHNTHHWKLSLITDIILSLKTETL